MSNEIAIYTEPQGVSLVDIRMDAGRFPRIKALSLQQATARLQQVVAMAFVYTGRPAEEAKIQMVAAALYNELLTDKKGLGLANITVEEIAHAVKDAILTAKEDVYVNIAFLYKAICAYAVGEGHDAQETAYARKVAAKQKALAATPAGVMLTAYTGALLKHSSLKDPQK